MSTVPAVSRRLQTCHNLMQKMLGKIKLQEDIAKQAGNKIIKEMYHDVYTNLADVCTQPDHTALFIEECLIPYWKPDDNGSRGYKFDKEAMRQHFVSQKRQLLERYEAQGFKLKKGAVEDIIKTFDDTIMMQYFEAICDVYTLKE